MCHILESQQFDRIFLEELFGSAGRLARAFNSAIARPGLRAYLAGKRLFTIFYEPSTWSRFSFEAAAGHLGMRVVSIENAREFSSAAKGETLEDTIRVLSGYHPDCIVLRHFETGSAVRAALVSSVSIISAGDGVGQHPTPSLLDVYTI